jgi:hypothetical protein
VPVYAVGACSALVDSARSVKFIDPVPSYDLHNLPWPDNLNPKITEVRPFKSGPYTP